MPQQWIVGDIRVTRLDATNFVVPTEVPMPLWAVPTFTPSVDEAPIAFSAIVVQTDDTTIVVDPWIVDDGPRTSPDADRHVEERLDQLRELGVEAEEVEIVVGTHLDGIGWHTRPTDDGWRPTFPNARYLFPEDELAAIDRGAEIFGADEMGPLHDAGVVERITAPYEVGPGVTLHDAHGHNPGHFAVRIESGDDLAVYPGHLVLTLLQVDDPHHDVGEADLATATATRRAVLGELADRGGVLLTTLVGGPGGGVVEANGDGFGLRTVS